MHDLYLGEQIQFLSCDLGSGFPNDATHLLGAQFVLKFASDLSFHSLSPVESPALFCT